MKKNNKVKIIFFESGYAGGSVHSLTKILNNWDFINIPAGLFSFSDKSKANKLLSISGLEFTDSFYTTGGIPQDSIVKKCGLFVPTLFGFKYFFKSLSILLKYKSACVYINNTPYSHIPLIISSLLLQRKIICHLRDTVEFTFLEKKIIKYVDVFISLSDAARNFYINQGVPTVKIQTIYNSINLNKFCINSTRVPEEILNVVVVGSLTYRKGQDICLKALTRVLVKHKNIKFFFVGDGEFRDELEKYVSKHELYDHVVFTGHTNDVLQIYRMSDIGVLTSRREGIPNSVMEYMAMGLPVIVSELPGIREVVDNNINGFVINQESDAELADKLIKLLENSDLRVEMGNKGIEKISSSQFDPDIQNKKILELVNSIINI